MRPVSEYIEETAAHCSQICNSLCSVDLAHRRATGASHRMCSHLQTRFMRSISIMLMCNWLIGRDLH